MTLMEYQKTVDEGRVIYLTGAIDNDLLAGLRKQMREILKEHPQSDLTVLLTTYGGGSTPGITIHNELKALATGRRVWLVCQSAVHSMGTYVILAVPKEQRVAFPLTAFYCHWGKFKWGYEVDGYEETHEYRIKEYQAAFEDYKREKQAFVRLLAEGTNLNEEEVCDLLANPHHIYEDEAISLGLIDHVLA